MNEEIGEMLNQFPTPQLREALNYLEDTQAGSALKTRLYEDPRVKALEGKHLSTGSGFFLFQNFQLGAWYYWYSKFAGVSKTDQALECFLESDEVEVIHALWVLGVKVAVPLELIDGISLVPTSSLPESRETHHLIRHRHAVEPFGSSLPEAALITRMRIPKLKPDERQQSSGSHAPHTALYTVAMLLNSFGGWHIQPSVSSTYREASTPVGPFGGQGGSRPFHDVNLHNNRAPGPISLPMLKLLFESRAKLPPDESRRFDLILDRLAQAKRHSDLAERILDFGIVLEMLLLRESSGKEQLSLTFRLRGAWLLGSTAAERIDFNAKFKRLYELRSKVAHTGTLAQKELAELRMKINEFEELTCQIYRALLIAGEPDWNSLVFGGILKS